MRRESSGRRVVVTGMGAITPSGNSVATLWQSVRDGHSAIRVLEGEEFDDLPVRIGGQVRDFDPSAYLPRTLARRLSPVQQWAIAAADQAVAQATMQSNTAETSGPNAATTVEIPDAAAPASAASASAVPGPDDLPWDPQRVVVIAATGSGPVDAMQAATRALDEGGPRSVPLTLAIHGAADAAAALLSQRYGTLGTAHAVNATCASGAIGLGDGLRLIRHGYADAVLVVGMEDCLGPVNLASNANMRALAAGYEDDPAAACRPFDRARAGFVMSSGAAAVLLEAEDTARSRDAEVLAELVGFGASSDAHHPTAPHPEGRGAAQAMRVCLADAGLGPDAVDHVNTHGTGTPAGDAAEVTALADVLGPRARDVPLTATKSATGHLLGAAGVVEAVLAVRSLTDGFLPPTLNLDDQEFDGWDIVTGAAREADIGTVLSTSFGFGGHNAAVLFAHR
nr:beta-ketoacyl-[acyl-carrier-protein] synthase family protein [Brevibacterium yomogidense]